MPGRCGMAFVLFAPLLALLSVLIAGIVSNCSGYLSFFPERETLRRFWRSLVAQAVLCAPAASAAICQALSCAGSGTSVLSRSRLRRLLSLPLGQEMVLL